MLRAEVNNEILKLFEGASYLEVGVWRGDTFHAVNAKVKDAVDPDFQFDIRNQNLTQSNASYHPMLSNDFFASNKSQDKKYDLIFLDGLHTYEQTLTDLLHAIDRTKDNGIIVVDDVIPDSYPASLHSQSDCFKLRNALNDPSPSWMGDVYKLVFFIESYLLNWSYFTVAENHGQLVMWRKPRSAGRGDFPRLSDICSKDYSDAVFLKSIFNISPLSSIVAEAKNR